MNLFIFRLGRASTNLNPRTELFIRLVDFDEPE
jgi:hypothetical protein